MIVAAALAMLVAVVPAPAADSLVVTSVDATAYPQVVVDFVVPERFAAVEVTPATVTVDGAPAEAVVPVDPTTVVVSLVVDDGPAVPAEVVGASQGGALELVRTIDAGTRIAVGTPSGLQTAFTGDPGATIARIAGIIAGAPAVTPLPQLILDAASALGTTDTADRHLVVVLGGPLGASEEQLSQLANLVASNGIALHLVSAAGPVEPALIPIADQSGGSVPIAGETLASFDAITAAISDRYRVTTTVGTPGEHVLALTGPKLVTGGVAMDGETMQAVVTVSPPTPAAPPPTTMPELASSPPVPSSPTVADEEVPSNVEANTTPTTAEAIAGTDVTAPPDDNTSPITVVAIVLMALLIVVAIGYVVFTRVLPRAVDVVPLADFSAHPVLEIPPEPKRGAEFVSREVEHEPAREPEHEPARVTDPDAVAARWMARPTPAHRTRGGGRIEPKPAPVAAQPSAGPEWLVSGNLRFCPASGEVSSGRNHVHLDRQEVAILKLLMTSGNRGVTQDDIIKAGNLDPAGRDLAPMLTRIRFKTGTRGQMVRRELQTVYIFDDGVDTNAPTSGDRRPTHPPAHR